MGSSRATSKSKAKRKKKSRKALLSSTRPNQVQPAKSAPLSSSSGRAVIRSYHTLHKRLSTAVACNDETTVRSVQKELDSLGGLKKYQDASFAGQGKERGGDTSGVLVEWLTSPKITQVDAGLRILEVGALDVRNACACCHLFGGGIERIDLNSRHPDIKEQDFMERPLPRGEEDRFDVISLSLVVNFVGNPKGRGDMLRRVSEHLRAGPETAHDERTSTERPREVDKLLPALFLVLPAPCVNNSRYLDEERLTAMLESLSYSLVRRKLSAKLVYYLWRFNRVEHAHELTQTRVTFAKEVIRKGKTRNNFAIVLR